MKTRYVVAFVGIIFLLTVGFCGGFVWMMFKDWKPYEPSKEPLRQAQAMLDSIATRTPEPDITPELWEVGQKECKDLLQSLMTRNNNQYKLTVYRIFGDHGTHIPGGTGSDEVLLHVDFPDGSRVQLYFYAAYLDECRKITD